MRHITLFVASSVLVLLSACSPSAPLAANSADAFTTRVVDDINLFVQGVRNPLAAINQIEGYIPSTLTSSAQNDIATQKIDFCPKISDIVDNKATVDFSGQECDSKIGDVTIDLGGKINFSGTPFESFSVQTSPAVSLKLSDGEASITGEFNGGMSLTKLEKGMEAAINAGYKLSGTEIETLAADYDLDLNVNKPSLIDSTYSFTGTIKYTQGNQNYTAQVSTPTPLQINAFDFCAGPVEGALQFKVANDVVDVVYTKCNIYEVSLNGKVL